MKKIIFILMLTPLLIISSCDNNDDNQIYCTLEAKAGLNITVLDATTNQPLAEGVVVSATDGNYQETLELLPGLEYSFAGAWERTGNYIITVTKDGYQTYTSSTIAVTADVCHVIPQSLTVMLQSN